MVNHILIAELLNRIQPKHCPIKDIDQYWSILVASFADKLEQADPLFNRDQFFKIVQGD